MAVMNRQASNSRELTPDDVRPFGRFGVGSLTGHPAGLLVIGGIIWMCFEAIPASRYFIGASLVMGGVFGFILWLRHR
jgi:hypothetical protein